MECKLTPAQRKECYEWVLEELKDPKIINFSKPFMCNMLKAWLNSCHGVHKYLELNSFEITIAEDWTPELLRMKPKFHYSSVWFPMNDIQSRISCLEASLILLKEKHPELWQND